jgi:hypothetical protein
MDTSGLSGIGAARTALEYQTSVEKLEQDATKQAGAAALQLIEGAAQTAQAAQPAPERPDGKGQHINIVA